MIGNFTKALEHLDESEGGFVNHKKDPGGRTNRGVTQRTYDSYRSRKRMPKQNVRYITQTEVEDIYKSMYWDAVRADELPSGLDYVAFDAAVNSGPSRAAKWLQKAVGVTADGKIGPQTLKAANSLSEAAEIVAIDRALDFRLGFMRRARHPITKALLWPTFKGGWSKRIDKVRQVSKEWARLPDDKMFDTPNTERPSFFELLMDAIEAIFRKD